MGEVTSVRPMLAEDISEVMAIEMEVNPQPWRRDDFLGFIPDSASRTVDDTSGALRGAGSSGGAKKAWVWADSRVRGFICGVGVAGEVELQSLAVTQAEWSRGIGSRLLQTLVDWAYQDGYSVIHLEVREGNTRAQDFYRQWNFAVQGRRPCYYTDSGEDALLFSRML